MQTINQKTVLKNGGAWVAQSIERPTLAHVMISGSVSSSPASGSVLTAQSLEPASDSVFLSLWSSPSHALSLSVSKINKHWKINKNKIKNEPCRRAEIIFVLEYSFFKSISKWYTFTDNVFVHDIVIRADKMKMIWYLPPTRT